ncbi:MAG: patatin-like phospholipase family protein [Deltaproteobacteria bacterium]|nr:patatin-like phospholipase family protein [Deltaproteobacteria bacterium]
MRAVLVAILTSSCFVGCARNWTELPNKRTCVVLSAGGPSGLVHLGVLRAVKDEGISVNCVTGTSMGALVGSLYATAPDAPLPERYTALMRQYEARTRETGKRNAIVGAIVGGALAAVATAGEPYSILGAIGAGAALGAKATDWIELERFHATLDSYYGSVTIERLPVAFATFFQQKNDTKMALVVASRGNLADAVGKSIANPYIFPAFDPVKAGYVDPGADRVAATPIEDTCQLFPEARLLAVNVTGQASLSSKNMRCPVLEVVIHAPELPTEAMAGTGAAFEAAVMLGYEETRKAIRGERAK